MEIVCEQCGDIGHKKDLIYCSECAESARHTYCMDLYPLTKDQYTPWLCEQCETTTKRRQQVGGGGGEKPQHAAAAEPLLRSAWSGSFDMVYDDYYEATRGLDGMHAYLSSKACRRVCDTATNDLCPVLRLEVVPRSAVWPKGFREGEGPTDANIGVYFIPSMEQESVYDYMVYEMIRDDLAMRASMGDVELLVFDSTVLPTESRRLQRKLYMWGVFKGKLQDV